MKALREKLTQLLNFWFNSDQQTHKGWELAYRSRQWFPKLTWKSKERAMAHSTSQWIQNLFDATSSLQLTDPVAVSLSLYGTTDSQFTKTSSQIQSMDFWADLVWQTDKRQKQAHRSIRLILEPILIKKIHSQMTSWIDASFQILDQ